MAKAHFEVEAGFDAPNKVQKATITIDRDNNLAQVRIHRRHKVYEINLETLAQMVYQRAVTNDLVANKPVRRRMVRRGLLSVGR
jgi:hypothetical protein